MAITDRAASRLVEDRAPILEAGRNCGAIHRSHRVAMLVDGDRYFGALAEVLERARRFVFFACWDLDSRIPLRRGSDGRGKPLRTFLEEIVARQPGLDIYFLNWDFAMIYTFEREHLPLFKLGWTTPAQIRFQMDDEHPVGASHHQKFVVADDRVAFVGGIDLTRTRWDTQEHRPGDPRRITPSGTPYMPFHDVQAAVDGDAARALGDLFRDRWRQATGEVLPALAPPPGDPWPPSVSPDLEDIPVGISQTRPAYRGRPAKSEILDLYLDAVARAERCIYIENQYLTSLAIVDALADSLSRDRGPEIVMVLPKKSEGWLEEKTMNALRRHHLKRLLETDVHQRLRVLYPDVEGLNGDWINVHSKLLIADDRLALFGSANLSNRSMGLDTECNVVVEARGTADRAAIARLRDRLLAEHFGSAPETVSNRIETKGSLIAAVSDLAGGPRTLRPLAPGGAESDIALRHQDLLDPERPTAFDRFVDRFMLEEKTVSKLRGALPLIGIIGGLLLLAALWNIPSLSASLTPGKIAESLREATRHPAAPLLAVAGFVVAGLLSFPITVLFVATALLFDVTLAIPVAMAGCLSSATTTYVIGLHLGRPYVQRIAGDRINGLSKWLARNGLLKTALIRMIPSAPFSVVNVVAGASHLRFRDYLLGTGLGMLPGILAITLLGDLVVRILLDTTPAAVAAFAGLSALLTGLLIWLLKRSRPLEAPRENDEPERRGESRPPRIR